MPLESIKLSLLNLGNHTSFLGKKVLSLWITSQTWNRVLLGMQPSVTAAHICLCTELLLVGNCKEMVMLYLPNSKTMRFIFLLKIFYC